MGPFVLPAVGATLTGAGLLGSLVNRPKYSTPDISGELNNIASMFASLRAQNTTNINRESAKGRSAAASNLAARGTLSSPVSEHVFTGLEGERVNAIANSDAQLAGQEAGMRTSLLRELLGLTDANQQRKQNANAALYGNLSGLGSTLLLSSLMRTPSGLGGSRNYSMGGDPFIGDIGSVA